MAQTKTILGKEIQVPTIEDIRILEDTVDMDRMKVDIAVEYDIHEDNNGVYIEFDGSKKYILEK